MSKKGNSRGGLGDGHRPSEDKYYFGTDAERANRIGTGYGDQDPANHAPHFVQMATANTGKDLNNPAIDAKSGNIKFSGGV